MATKKQGSKKPKQARFSVAQLKDEVSVYDEYIETTVTSLGRDYIVKLWPFFSPERVRNCVNELIEFYKLAEKEKLDVPQIEESELVGYFICKHFTNMLFTSSKKAKNVYAEFKIAMNSQLFKTLITTFPKDSIQSVYDHIYEVVDASLMLQGQFQAAQDLVKNMELENREIIEQIGKSAVENLENKQEETEQHEKE